MKSYINEHGEFVTKSSKKAYDREHPFVEYRKHSNTDYWKIRIKHKYPSWDTTKRIPILDIE